MPRRTGPKLCHHRGQELGYVTLNRKEFYLGRWPREQKQPPQEVLVRYNQVLAEWHARLAAVPEPVSAEPTVLELCVAYIAHAEGYYVKRGKPTTEPGTIKDALKPVAKLYGEARARTFGPKALKAVRAEMVQLGWARGYIGKQVSRVRRMFRWAAENELVPSEVWRDLQAVRGLPKGRGLREEEPVRPVKDEAFAATLPHLPASLRQLAQVHRLLGCRAQDACVMRAADIDRGADPEGGLWLYTPSEFKGEHLEASARGRLHYWIGPQAQEILRPLLDQPGEWLFPTGRRRGRGCWTTSSYRRAVERACRKAGVPRWSPLQVRHTAGTAIRARYGVEGAQVVLGHAEVTVTQLYAERDENLARRVMREMG